jgi:hypothetical protein
MLSEIVRIDFGGKKVYWTLTMDFFVVPLCLSFFIIIGLDLLEIDKKRESDAISTYTRHGSWHRRDSLFAHG